MRITGEPVRITGDPVRITVLCVHGKDSRVRIKIEGVRRNNTMARVMRTASSLMRTASRAMRARSRMKRTGLPQRSALHFAKRANSQPKREAVARAGRRTRRRHTLEVLSGFFRFQQCVEKILTRFPRHLQDFLPKRRAADKNHATDLPRGVNHTT